MDAPGKRHLFALLLGLCTVIVCLAIADGMIGVEGTIHDYTENEYGEISFTLHVKDPTGRIIFWAGLLLLPVLFARRVTAGSTWVNLPLYLLAWYLLSAIFGSHPNHRYLAHPGRGFINLFQEFNPIYVTLFLWLTQLAILLTVRGMGKLIRKLTEKKETTV